MSVSFRSFLSSWYAGFFKEEMTQNIRLFLKNLRYAVFGYGISAVCIFAFEILTGRTLGLHKYGEYGIVCSVGLFIYMITNFGLHTAVVKYLSETDDVAKQRSIISTGYIAILGISILLNGALFLSADYITQFLSISPVLLRLSILFAFCMSLYVMSTDILRGLHQIKKLSALTVAYGAMLIGSFFIFYLQQKLVFDVLIGIVYFSYFIVFLYISISMQKYLSPAIDRELLAKLFNYGLFALIGEALFIFLPICSKLFIAKYLPVENVGIYNAYYFASINMMFFFYTIVVSVFFPTASKFQGKKSIADRIRKITPYIFVAGVPALALCECIVLKLYGASYPIEPLLVLLFAVSGLLIFTYSLYGWLFYSRGIRGAKAIARVTLGICVINILLNLFLIPVFSILGAITSIIITYAIGLLYLWIKMQSVEYSYEG